MNFYIIIKKRIAEVLTDGGRRPLLVCGNSDNRIVFTFDEEWSENAIKTARFVYRENNGHGSLVYRDAPFTGNSVAVPDIENISELWLGVSSSEGITTSAARIACVPSIGGLSTEESNDSGEAVEVELMLADGDQLVEIASGNPMSSVTIKKPEALIPENIRAGVTIAGVVGTCSSASTTLEAPTVSLDGDVLNVSYHNYEAIRYLWVCVDGVEVVGALTPDEDCLMEIKLKNFLVGYEAGTYSITIKANGYGSEEVVSEAVSYDYDGTVEEQAYYFVALGGDNIEISYKIGDSDLSDYVDTWEEIEPDGTLTTNGNINGLTPDKYVLLYLPENVVVSDYLKCDVKVYDDPRFVQLYNFVDDGFAMCNFAVAESLSAPTISLSGDVLTINYDPDTTECLTIYVNTGTILDFFVPESDGQMTVNLKDLFDEKLTTALAGTYQITVEADGADGETALSEAVSYTYVKE